MERPNNSSTYIGSSHRNRPRTVSHDDQSYNDSHSHQRTGSRGASNDQGLLQVRQPFQFAPRFDPHSLPRQEDSSPDLPATLSPRSPSYGRPDSDDEGGGDPPLQHRTQSSRNQQRQDSWDYSSREVQRIRSKTHKLRASRDNTQQHQSTHLLQQPQLTDAALDQVLLADSMGSFALSEQSNSGIHLDYNPRPASRHEWVDDAESSRAESSNIHNNNNNNNNNNHNSINHSPALQRAQQKLMRNFHSTGRRIARKETTRENEPGEGDSTTARDSSFSAVNSTLDTTTTNTTHNTQHSITTNANDEALQDDDSLRFALHDLCAEAVETDDIAWRNALSLLANSPELALVVHPDDGWLPLHVACLGQPPVFIIRALLYAAPQACQVPDTAGRLPLHLLAASHANPEIFQLVAQEYPAAIYTTDQQHGLTPLHVLIKNKAVELTVQRLRMGLGWTVEENKTATDTMQPRTLPNAIIQFRKGQHLELDTDALEQQRHRTRPTTFLNAEARHEAEFDLYPIDVRRSLRQLTAWKKKQMKPDKRNTKNHSARHRADTEDDMEQNPAAIWDPETLRLPIHMLIHRGMVLKQPIEKGMELDDKDQEEPSSSTRKDNELEDLDRDVISQEKDGSDDEGSVVWTEASKEKNRPSVPHVEESLRLLVAAHPPSLLQRDGNGSTPLIQVLQCEPTLAVVDLLLGKRSPQYNDLPAWAHDLPTNAVLTSPSSSAYTNPAMLASSPGGQLPLHIAAEEALSVPILQSIHDSYPGAVQTTDARGRTPLHLALSSYRRIHDPKIVALLFQPNVAHIRDDAERVPLDYMLDGAEHLPQVPPMEWNERTCMEGSRTIPSSTAVYQNFFRQSLLVADERDNDQSCHDKRKRLLSRLRALPPWLRQAACSVGFVQEGLVEELARPWHCAIILLDGFALIALIVVFRLQLKEHLDEMIGVPTSTVLSSQNLLPTWYTFSVYATASYRLLSQATYWIISASLDEFRYLVLLNPWSWLDAAAMILALVTSVFLTGGILSDDEQLLTLGTVSTGFLWLALIGYLSTWLHGMSIFTGAFCKIVTSLIWPIVAAGVLIIAGAQMFYTLLYLDCDTAISSASICSVRGSYRLVFALVRGESFIDLEGDEEMTMETIILVAMFLLLLSAFAVAILLTIIMAAASLDSEQIALENFWEPKLAFVFPFAKDNDKEQYPQDITYTKKNADRLVQSSGFYAGLERAWDSLMLPWSRGGSINSQIWYTRSARSKCSTLLFGALALLIVPLWFLAGFLSVGLLWPPQVRRSFFRPWVGRQNRARKQTNELTTMQLSEIRKEMLNLKHMNYSKSEGVEKELVQLKELLRDALKEE